MADKRISELTAATSLADADLIPIVQGGETKRLSGSAVKAYVASTDQPSVISVSSSSDALRITQTGAGNALVVEDSANPDATPFVVDANGKAIVGHTSALATVAYSGAALIPNLQTQGVGMGVSALGVANWANNNQSPASIVLSKSKSNAVGTFGVVASGDVLGSLSFTGDDGTAFINAAYIQARVDGTPGTNNMPGRLVFSTTADGASSPTERMRITNDGRLIAGLGAGAGSSATQLTLGGTLVSAASTTRAFSNIGTAPTTSTSSVVSYFSQPTTADGIAATNIFHFLSSQGTITGGTRTAPTAQYGFHAESSLTGATNNYGFYSNIASGTGRYNFYAAGTADNYFAGNIGIGATSLGATTLNFSKTITGSNFAYGAYCSTNVNSDVTSVGSAYAGSLGTVAASFTLANLRTYTAFQGTIGAGSVVTNQVGFYADSSMTGATNNFGFYSNIASGTGRYNFYAAGTADNYFAGRVGVGIGATTNSYFRLGGNLTGEAYSNATYITGQIQSDVLSEATYVNVSSSQAAGFTVPSVKLFSASQGTYSGTVTTQYGFFANSSLTGATNNYGFYSNIASGTGRYNFYAAGTADNYFAGPVVVSTSSSSDALRITQTGAGNALVVEDSANPDSTPFVINQSGTVGIGITNPGAYVTTGMVVKASASYEPQVQLWNAVNDVSAGYSLFKKDRAGAIVQSGDFLGTVEFQGFDGTSMISAARIISAVDGTPGTNDMPGRLVFSTTADGASTPTERMRIDSAGRVGVGSGANADTLLTLAGTYPSAGSATFAQQINGTIPSATTNLVSGYRARVSTQAAAFNLATIRIFDSGQGSIGSGSSITTQYGYYADPSLTGATNNYGFYSNIASGTGRYNFYAAGTADNYFAGLFGVKALPSAGINIISGGNYTGAVYSYGYYANGAFQSDVTNTGSGYVTALATQAAAFTLTNMPHYWATQSTIGAGSAVTNQFGFKAESSLTGATNNYGFYSNIASGTGRYNFFANGSADNYFAGRVGIGSTAASITTLNLSLNMTGGTTTYGVLNLGTVQSDSTSQGIYFRTNVSTAAAAFTLSDLYHYQASQGTFGAGSTVTNQYGFSTASTLTGATNNYGFYSNIASGTGRWNFYAAGSASNYLGGDLTFKPLASATPANNGDLTFEATSNTSVKIKLKGSDGVVRSVTLTLA